MEDKLGFPNKNNKIIWEYPKKDEPDFFFFGWTWYFTLKKILSFNNYIYIIYIKDNSES